MSDEPIDPQPFDKRLSGSMKLVETTCTLAALHNLDQILKSVPDNVCVALDCERASLYLLDEQQQELYTQVVTELEIEEIRSPLDFGITGWVARRRKVANIPDPMSDARWNSAIDRKTGFQTRNILATPLISAHDDRLVGVLQLLNKRDGCFDDFDEQLIQAFASHAAVALERAQLMETARRSQVLELSHKMGRDIQAGFLPDALPEIPGYEVAAWWQPAEAVSGDYYDAFFLPDGRLALVIADVSGHGVAASLIMASVRAMLRVLARTLSDPPQILSLLSETIDPDLNNGRFITCLIAAIDLKSHEIAFANAGQGPALFLKQQTQTVHELESTGLPIGFDPEFSYAAGQNVPVAVGDIFLVGTDGLIELKNVQGELFGKEGLERLLLDHCEASASEMLTLVQQAVKDHHPEAPPHDDMTLMVLKRTHERPCLSREHGR